MSKCPRTHVSAAVLVARDRAGRVPMMRAVRRIAFCLVLVSAFVWLTWRQATSLDASLLDHDFDVDADVGELAEKSPPPSGFFGVRWKSVEELANWLVKKEG
eukprot:6010333-Amphidinium_carterae.1